MSNALSWNLRVNINEGMLETFQSLMAEMVEATQANEPDTLVYEWYFSDDNSACHIVEAYTDSAAAMVHIGNFGANFAERFLTYCSPTEIFVYGTPSDEARAALDGFGATYMPSVGGFTR